MRFVRRESLPMDEILQYFRDAIECPYTMPPWKIWWQKTNQLVLRTLGPRDYERIRKGKIDGARMILRRAELTWAAKVQVQSISETVLTEAEWKAVYVVVLRKKVPKRPPKLRVVVLLIARLGGHLGRKSDPPPGPKAMWTGLQKARTLALGWQTFGPGAKTYA